MTSRITAKTCTPNVSDLCSKVVHNPTMRSLWGLWRALPCGRLVPHLHDTTGCQSSYTTHFDNRLYRVNGALLLAASFLYNRVRTRYSIGLGLLPGRRPLIDCNLVIMPALWNMADHYIFILWFLLLSFFFPRLFSAVAYWMSTILPHMV